MKIRRHSKMSLFREALTASKTLRIAAVLLLALSFLTLPLHHHDEGGAFCAVCLFVKTFCVLVLLCFVSLLQKTRERLQPVWFLGEDSLLFQSVSLSRAPPSR